jgi:hypothetical protein
MPKLERDAFMERIKAIVGEATDDDALSFIADMTDTYDGLAQPSDWEEKYNTEHAAHEALRKEYRDRFFSGGGATPPDPEPDKPGAEEITYEDLFK